MTSTGTRMRRAVAAMAVVHCFAVSRSIRPEISAATNTPVPAADSQLSVKRAASGFAPGGATGLPRRVAVGPLARGLRLQQESLLRMPDEAQKERGDDDGDNAGDDVGDQMKR